MNIRPGIVASRHRQHDNDEVDVDGVWTVVKRELPDHFPRNEHLSIHRRNEGPAPRTRTTSAGVPPERARPG